MGNWQVGNGREEDRKGGSEGGRKEDQSGRRELGEDNIIEERGEVTALVHSVY